MSIKIGIGLKIAPSGGIDPAIPIIRDGHTFAWYKWDEATTITMNGSNQISAHKDFLGSGHDMLNAAAVGTKPIWSAEAIKCDGVSQRMTTASHVLAQPTFIFGVIKQKTYTNNKALFDGYTLNSVRLHQTDPSPNTKIYAGSVSQPNANFAVDKWSIVRIYLNGASTFFQYDTTAKVIGTAGTNAMNGFTVGCRGSNIDLFGNLWYREFIIRDENPTASQEQTIYDYLVANHSSVLGT